MKLDDLKLGIDGDIQNNRDRARIMQPHASPLLPDSAKLLRKARVNSRALENLGEKVRIAKENSTVGILERRVTITREQRQEMNGVGSPGFRLRSNQPEKNDQTNSKSASRSVTKHQNTDQKDTLFGVKPKSQDKKSQLPLLKLLNLDQASRPSSVLRNLQDVSTAREISSAQEKENLTDRIEHSTEHKGTHLFHSKSAKEASAHSKQLQSAPLKPKVILEHAIIREGRSLDTVVIKEPFRDRYSIFAMDFLSGQRYELHFSSEDVQNILEGDILVTSVEEKQVWTSLLQKVDLRPVKDFSKIKTRDIPSTGAKIKVFEKFQNGLFSPDSVEGDTAPFSPDGLESHGVHSFANLPQIIVPTPAASSSACASSSASSCATSARTAQGHRRGTVQGTTPPIDISDYILPQHSYGDSFEDNLSREDSADYDLEFDSFEASDDYHTGNSSRTRGSVIPSINTKKAEKLEEINLAHIYPQYNVERDIAEAYKPQRNGYGSNNDKMSPMKKISDASGGTPHSRRSSLQPKPATPHSVQQRAKSVPHEAIRAAIGDLQPQPHPPKTTHGVGHRQPGGRTKQGEAMSRLAAPPKRSPRPPPQLSPGMSGIKPKGQNISLIQVGQASPEGAVDPPSVTHYPAPGPKSVDRVKFHPVPPLEPVQHISRPHRSQANKKAVPGKTRPSGSDPAKLSISVKAAPGRKKQAPQLFITAAPLSIENLPDNHASNFSSPYLQAAAGYNYEADDYEVDYEIFSVNPGSKLPLLGAALAVSVSPVPETHRLEEPSMSSRSLGRTFNDDSACVLDQLMVTVPERKMDIFDGKMSASRESFSLDNSVVLPDLPLFSKESDVRKVVLEVEVPSRGADVITSEPGTGTGTGTYSKEGQDGLDFEDDSFSYGSIGGWDNYVDEDVEGESYDLDEEEINAAESQAVTLASSSVPVQRVGVGKGSGSRTGPAPGPGGKGHRYERSMYSEFDTSANTTVCLNSAAIREVVRNLDEGVEYRDMPICNQEV